MKEPLAKYLRQQPFVPFRLTTSSGESCDIRHPEVAWITSIYIAIAQSHPRDRWPVVRGITTVSMLHITAVHEMIPAPADEAQADPKENS